MSMVLPSSMTKLGSTPTEKMANFLKGLERKTGLEAHPDAWENFDTCRSEIDRLQGSVPQ